MGENKFFEVRHAVEADASAIAQITRDAFGRYCAMADLSTCDALCETPEDIIRDIKEKIVLVAYIDDEVVGSVRVTVNEAEKTAYLSRFGVSMKYQNLGIGKALINMVDITMRSIGVREISLHTASKASGLVRFYYGRGYYIDSTDKSRGYIRALLVKKY
ncbi:MAG: GNAT family N-acetyltransferase [Clostridia bacterium]|nr:GNAT family N-acetyltransferase [Clostridia bacterium]